MGIISWIIVGGLAGWIASMIMKKNAGMGVLANIVVGIIGGIVGGFIARFFGFNGITGFNLGSLLIAIIGSCIVLYVINKLTK
jgi:uncharacterized membrane protein YeaQ/YmgE (transglycosylase-associated protein family)